MKKMKSSLTNARLKSYSTMAIALTAGVNTLNAEIIYTDIDDVVLEVDDIFNLDINGDGSLEFQFSVGSNTSSGSVWSFGSVFGLVSASSVGNSANQVIGYTGAYFNYGSALNSGDQIGPDGPWLSYPSYGNSAVLASNYYGVTYGDFPGQGERFLGIKFSALGNIHYGWVRVVADLNPVSITIMDYAYDNTANQAIEAGATISVGIPELPAGSVNIYSHANTINIVNTLTDANATALVFDLEGKLVMSENIREGLNQLTLSNAPAGNYIIQIASLQGNISKQVFIN